MTDDDIVPPAPAHPRRNLRPAWVALAAGMGLVGLALTPLMPVPKPSPWLRLGLVPVMAAGLSLPLAALWANRAHARQMLRYSHGKAIAAVLMAGFTPVSIWGVLPSALGFFALLAWGNLDGLHGTGLRQWLLATLAPLPAYPFAAALIWGLPRLWRLAGFIGFYALQLALVAWLGRVFPGGL